MGPFAPSPTIFALIRPAFADVIWFSSAHGARITTSSSRRSSFVIFFVPGYPWTLPVFSLKARTFTGSNPFGSWIPPVESETATIFEPSSACMSRA